MRFSTSFALVAVAIAPVVVAQSVTIDPVTLTQCANSTITFETQNSTGPYYVAVIPASDPCTEDALAEFYDVTGNSVSYYVNQPSGTQVQAYVLDANGDETWGQIETVGDGDGSCLPGASIASLLGASTPSSSDLATNTSSSDPATSTSSSSSSSSSSAAPSSVPPVHAATTPPASSYVPPYTGDSDNTDNTSNTNSTNSNDTPANAADNTTNGASTLTASASLFVGAIVVAAALL